MASDEERLVVSLEARIRDFEKNFQKAAGTSNDAWSRIEARGKRGAAHLESSFAQATKGVGEHVSRVALETAGALTAALGVEELRRMADEWNLFRGRIAAAGVDAGQLNAKLRELSDIAIRSHATLEQVGTVYTALRRAAAELGASEVQTVRATETLQKALTLGGQGQQDTAAAILEISHALAGGRINGVELNKLLMEAPTLVKAIAKEFGVSTGQLRALKEEGQELDAAHVFKGILDGSKEIDASFTKLRPTISQAMQMLNTSMTRYVGEADQADGVTRTLASGIMALGDHMNVTAPAAFALAAGLSAAFIGGPIVGGITAATVALIGFSTIIRPIHGELATIADYARVAFDLVREKGGQAAAYLEERFSAVAASLSEAMSGIGLGWRPLLSAVKTLANAIIGAFAFAANSIMISWGALIPELAEVTLNAVNGVISAIEGMVNKVASAINVLIEGLNKLSHTNFSPMGMVDLGRITDASQGAAQRTAKAFGEAFKDSFRDYVGGALDATEDALKAFHDRANQLAKAEAPPASKPLGDEGSLDQPLKSAPDPKKIKAYNEILNKSREWIQSQELERRELTESAEAASALRHEQELLNEASSKEIRLTEDQRKQIRGLAEEMAHAETATQHLVDMKAGIEELGQAITDDLSTAIEGLITRTRTWEQSLRSLGEMLVKAALDAALWGKGPIAEITGQKDNGILSQAVRGMLPKSNAQPQQFLPTPAIPIQAGTANITAGTVNGAKSISQGGDPRGLADTAPAIKGASAAAGAVTQTPLPPVRPGASIDASAATGSASEVDAARAYLRQTAAGNAAARSRDIDDLNPDFAVKMAASIKEARAQGLPDAGVFSGARTPDATHGRGSAGLFDMAGYSMHPVGMASDVTGIGGPGSADAKKWYDIATKHGLHNPYGADNPREWNHYQAVPQRNLDRDGPVEPFYRDRDRSPQRRIDMWQAEGLPMHGVGGPDQAEQAAEKARKLAEQMRQTSTATADLTGTLAKTAPAAESFTGSLGGLLSKLASGLGGSGAGSAASAAGGVVSALTGALTFADGGDVKGPGTGTSDSIPAMLSHGEFVTNAKATSKHRGLLESINAGKVPHFSTGGVVGGDSFANTSSYSPQTTINLTGSGDARADARLADRVQKGVSDALAAHNKPDTFRRSAAQQHAHAFQVSQRAHAKNA